MNKFRIGDTVRRVDTWDLSVGLPSGEVGVVSVLHGNDIVEIKGCGGWLHTTESLELVEQIADELPPAPESVLYHHQNHMGLDSNTYLTVLTGDFWSGPCIRLQNPSNTFGITIDADTALQLCHDLRRMAMSIKKKGKQDAAK